MQRDCRKERVNMNIDMKELRIAIYKNALKSHIQNDMDDIRDFFKNILDKEYDCIVFISRRCYILFLMYVVTEGWQYHNIRTDLGIFARRELLKTSKSVLIVDDIGYTGSSMQRVSKRLVSYIPLDCQLDAVLYAVNKRYLSDIHGIKLDGLRKLNIKTYAELTNRQCQELSAHLVSAILSAGIPYITFIYPTWGEVKKNFKEDYEDFIVGYKKSLFKEYRWKNSFLNLVKEKNMGWTNWVGDYSCVRIYQSPNDNVMYFLPFVFLKSLKADKVNEWYHLIADVFEKSDAKMVAEEIRETLNVDKTWEVEAIEYLSCMFSCFCSKSIAEFMGLQQYVEEVEGGYVNIFCDSFSEVFVDALRKCDRVFVETFWDNFCKIIPLTEKFFVDTRNLEQSYFDDLVSYLKMHADIENVYEISYKVFEWMKSEESDKFFVETDKKFIKLDDMTYLLESRFGFKKEEIYLAQIECWDIGIATYRLHYDQEKGIIAICNAGEMSSVVNQIKYQELIKIFYDMKYQYDSKVTDQLCREIVREIIKEEMKKDRYTKRDLDEFYEIAEEQSYSFYDMLI